jgi:hypothetical protein
MFATSIWRLLLRGFCWGIAASLFGSLVFGVVGLLITVFSGIVTYSVDISKWEFNLLPQTIWGLFPFLLYLIVFGTLFSLIPSAVGGVALAGLLQLFGSRTVNSSYIGTIMGSLVGGMAGVVSSFSAVFFLLGGQVGGLAHLAVLAWIIAFALGGLVGRRLARHVVRGTTIPSNIP